jgi:hypothetical protein
MGYLISTKSLVRIPLFTIIENSGGTIKRFSVDLMQADLNIFGTGLYTNFSRKLGIFVKLRHCEL